MASELIEKYREKAEIFHDEELCMKKSIELLEEMLLPNNLLPVDEMEEVGISREAGVFWLKLKKAQKYKFPKVSHETFYAPEISAFFFSLNKISAFIEPRRLKDLKGVSAKELMITFNIFGISIDDPSSGKINFKTTRGLSLKHPISCFEVPKTDEE